MERRLITFIIASTAFFFVYFSLRNILVPPPPPIPPGGAPNALVAEKDDEQDAATDPERVAESSQINQTPSDTDETSDLAEIDVAEIDSAEINREQTPTWLTLGSMDPTSGHVMLVTLNSKGGAIERIELTEREGKNSQLKYRRVDVRHGYLGYFAATAASAVDGVKVNVVGPGTPAAEAGIQVGDIITSINGIAIRRRIDIDTSLLESKPEEIVRVEILRGFVDQESKSSSDDSDSAADLGTASAPISNLADTGQTITLDVTLSEHPLDLVRLSRDGGADEIKGNLSRLSCLMTLAQVNRKGIGVGQDSIPGIANPADLVWNTQVDGQPNVERGSAAKASVSFSLQLSAAELASAKGQAIELVRSYQLTPGSYVIDMSIEMRNGGNQAQDLAYRLEGPNGLTLEGWWYSNKISPNFSGPAARDIVYKNASDGHALISGYALHKRAKKQPEDAAQTIFAPDSGEPSQALKYIAVDAQYFVTAYLPPADQTYFSQFQRAAANLVADVDQIQRHKERAVNSSFFLTSKVVELEPGESIRQDLRLFAGPKEPDLVANYGLSDVIYYGWFALFARFLSGLLHIISGLVGNYALAIIVLTVIVRAAMFPLSRKAAVNAQRMQELAPELKKIAERYKDDMEGRMKAQRDLQKRVGFNPMAGCLPMFLQLPIFIGLYRALSVDIELRQQPFSSMMNWASNLAGPDMLAYWGDWMFDYFAGRGTGWLGPYFNILPVIVVALFLLQQKLFMPPATDEQTAMTQKMMNIMTLMMGLFFFRVPAGLCIYFITSSLWGICERVLVKKTIPDKKHFDLSVIEGTATPTEKKATGTSLTDRVRQKVGATTPEPMPRPNKRRRPPKKK